MVAPTPSGHSAQVKLELHVNGDRWRLAQFGGDILIFARGVILPGTSGEVVAHIDERIQRWAVTWEPCDTPREVVRTICREIE